MQFRPHVIDIPTNGTHVVIHRSLLHLTTVRSARTAQFCLKLFLPEVDRILPIRKRLKFPTCLVDDAWRSGLWNYGFFLRIQFCFRDLSSSNTGTGVVNSSFGESCPILRLCSWWLDAACLWMILRILPHAHAVMRSATS